jgi:hypothetical protein
MKKLIVVLVLLFAATVVFGQAIQLGDFPVGKWLDANYDAVWEFSSNNIRVLDSNTGEVYYDFAGMTQNFRVGVAGIQPTIQFGCSDAGRTYAFRALLPGNNLTMEIEREGLPKYTVTLTKQ